MNLQLVIMAGGSGTRFWPKSTAMRPKQLLAFGGRGSQTLLEQTLSRFDGLVPGDAEHRMIVTAERLRAPIASQAPRVSVLAEPQARNTAPCVYWAARAIAARDPRAIMLVMPSDHFIPKREAFLATVKAAAEWASSHDDLVTLGVKPTRPETGYGYLRVGAAIQGDCRKVEAFVEKPRLDKAREFVAAGNYFWNGGMFVWRAETILRAFDQHMPEMRKAWDEAGGDFEKAWPRLTATSIDYGVMEKASNVVTFALDCGWDDLGSWTSLEELGSVLGIRHEAGVVAGAPAVSVESSGNIVNTESATLVALLGVKDLVIVEHGGVILVADKHRAQDIKLVVEQVKAKFPDRA